MVLLCRCFSNRSRQSKAALEFTIRKSHETTVPGVPDILYFFPEQSGEDRQDCLAQVPLCKLEEVEQEILGWSREEETDEVWEEYFHYVMENNGLT